MTAKESQELKNVVKQTEQLQNSLSLFQEQPKENQGSGLSVEIPNPNDHKMGTAGLVAMTTVIGMALGSTTVPVVGAGVLGYFVGKAWQ
jgi:hypothetical protein